jgi:hypothetical protein
MSLLTLDAVLPVALPVVGATAGNRQEDPIAARIEHVLAAAYPVRRGAERRRDTRFPYPHPVYLTPCDADREADETIVVIGRHLSLHGIDFYHRQPLPYRRVIASLDAGEHGWLGLLLELSWCRFNRHGWYDNGGRFLGVVESPLGGRA